MKRAISIMLLTALTLGGVCACAGPNLGGPPVALAGAQAPRSTDRPEAAGVPTTAIKAGSACNLVTIAEVSTAAATPMKVVADGGPAGECIFAALSDPSNVLYLEVDKSQMDIDQRKQQLESSSDHVAGLGDDAFFNGTIGEVFLQSGARALIITLPSLSNLTHQPAANKERMVALARSAFARF